MSCPATATRLFEVTVIVAPAPEASEPEAGETLTLPSSALPTAIA